MSYISSSGAGTPGDWDQSQENYGRHPKAVSQREYRKREGDVFSELRNIIKQLNDHNPQTRHDILSEASRLLRQLGDENENLRRQLRRSGGNSTVPPTPPAHTVPAYGQGEVSWAATHSPTTSSTQIPHMFPQAPALAEFMAPGSMPEVDRLMLVTAEQMQMQRSNNTHPSPWDNRK